MIPVANRATIGRPVDRARDSKAGPTGSPGADAGQHVGEVLGEGTVAAAYDAVECGDRALARGHGEREQLGDSRELREDLPLAVLDLRAQPVVAEEHPADEPEQAEHHGRRDAADTAECTDQAEGGGGGEAHQSPHHLFDAEVLDGPRRSPARSRRRRTDEVPPITRSTRSAAEPSTGPKIPAAADVGDDETVRCAGPWSRRGRSRR